MCSPDPINCYPMLVNIISNTFLRLFNSTARFCVSSQLFHVAENAHLNGYIFFVLFIYLLVLSAGFPPLFAMSNVEDSKVKSMSCRCRTQGVRKC
ncbi:ABCA8 protein, partial [Spelaeornis formosus]|nr:ABCA8 protein [Elachura formosa]